MIHDMDSLADVCAQSSLVAPNNHFLSRFHSQISQLLSSNPSVEHVHHGLQTLLLPELASRERQT